MELKEIKGLNLLRLKQPDVITIPKKSKSLLKHLNQELLIKFHKDINYSYECILLLVSFFNSTHIGYIKDKNITIKFIHSKILKDVFGKRYHILIKVLLQGTKNGSIIKLEHNYSKDNFSKGYSLNERYLGKGFEIHKLYSKRLLKIQREHYNNKLQEIFNDNSIALNLIFTYNLITLPTIDEIIIRGKQLQKQKYTKRGKRLKLLGHKQRFSNISYIEDHIKIYEYLTLGGLFIPHISKKYGRITDSLNLMPSWIRNMIKINGEETIELDYSTLHPNIVNYLYGSKEEQKISITHKDISTYYNTDINKIKKQHLSYFNLTMNLINHYDVSGYYKKFFPIMNENFINDKKLNGYMITTDKVFNMEVEIMTEVVRRVNECGIFVIYIYDALSCDKSNGELVREIMNEVVNEMGVNTYCK